MPLVAARRPWCVAVRATPLRQLLQVWVPAGTAMALKPFSTAAHSALVLPQRSLAEAMAPLRAAA